MVSFVFFLGKRGLYLDCLPAVDPPISTVRGLDQAFVADGFRCLRLEDRQDAKDRHVDDRQNGPRPRSQNGTPSFVSPGMAYQQKGPSRGPWRGRVPEYVLLLVMKPILRPSTRP